jgi:hypothetical protein
MNIVTNDVFAGCHYYSLYRLSLSYSNTDRHPYVNNLITHPIAKLGFANFFHHRNRRSTSGRRLTE